MSFSIRSGRTISLESACEAFTTASMSNCVPTAADCGGGRSRNAFPACRARVAFRRVASPCRGAPQRWVAVFARRCGDMRRRTVFQAARPGNIVPPIHGPNPHSGRSLVFRAPNRMACSYWRMAFEIPALRGERSSAQYPGACFISESRWIVFGPFRAVVPDVGSGVPRHTCLWSADAVLIARRPP